MIEEATWRESYAKARRMFVTGTMDEPRYRRWLATFGFRAAEVDAEVEAARSAPLVTTRELRKLSSPAQHPHYLMTIPAGTRCERVPGQGGGIAVADVSKVRGGNAHDLKHYYVWLSPDEVQEGER